MYCGQCGKKVLENMLFCPFCGSPIVIPDQDEVPPAPPVQESMPLSEAPAEPVPERPVSLFDGYAPMPVREREIPQEDFKPLRFDFDQNEFIGEEPQPEAEPVSEPEPEPETEVQMEEDRPARRPDVRAPRPEGARRTPNTYIPVKELAPDDIFMDEVHHEDAYDDEYDDAYDRTELDDDDDFIDDFEFEEKEHGGFFQRHIRGIVGLLLFLLLLVICAVWAFSPKGQLVLAKMNLAWTPQVYADLGYAAYQQDSDKLAARYYEKALARDESNYEYAHSAMVAYYEADEIEAAAAMLKKCIEMDPDNPEPYQEMLILYPDAKSRPWEVSELIRLGYQRTGDATLKQN